MLAQLRITPALEGLIDFSPVFSRDANGELSVHLEVVSEETDEVLLTLHDRDSGRVNPVTRGQLKHFFAVWYDPIREIHAFDRKEVFRGLGFFYGKNIFHVNDFHESDRRYRNAFDP